MNRRVSFLLFMAFMMVIVVVGNAFAADPLAPLPDAFWGIISSADGSAVNGGTINAYIGGRLAGSRNFSGNKYGENGGIAPKLIVQGPESEVGQEVTFSVNGVTATTTDKYDSAQIKQLDIVIPYYKTLNRGGGGGSTSSTTPIPTTLIDINNHWAKDYIAKLVSLGIINGYGDGSFKPDNTITRGEFAKMIVLATGIQPLEDSALLKLYKDYASLPEWLKPYAAEALKAKIMKGYLDKTLKVGNRVTRAEVAVMVANAMSGNEKANLKFKDAKSIPTWAKDAIAKVFAGNLVNGYPDGNFRPGQFVTRAEAAKIISLFMDKK